MRLALLLLFALLGALWASAAGQNTSPKPPKPRPPPRPPRPPPRPPALKPPPRPPRPPPVLLRGPPRPPKPPPPPPRSPPQNTGAREIVAPPPPVGRPSPPPPIPTAGGGGSALLGGGGCPDAQAVFDTTNMYRGWHQAPPLTWSASLAAAAQAYAEVLAPKGCPLIHAGVGGENLYTTTQYPKPDNTCLRAITAWYSEEPYYDYTVANAFQYNWPRGIGHFTAMVWKSGRSFGCGVARADVPMSSMPGGFAGCKIVVCRYSLPVNLADNTAFKQNVLPKV